MASDLAIAFDAFVTELLSRVHDTVRDGVAAGLAGIPAAQGPRTAPSVPGKVGGVAEWVPVDEMPIKSGKFTFITKPGYPCRVKGLGRGGKTGDGWTIRSITTRNGEFNVEVTQGRGEPSRTVKGDRIIYKRPPKGDGISHQRPPKGE